MLTLGLLSLLATTALSNPLSQDSKPARQPRCTGAGNCETWVDSAGNVRNRFKRGMEPGTEDYTLHLAKRDTSYPQTQITVGDATIVWGCGIDPVATLNNVSAICSTSGQCITNAPWSIPVQYVSSNPGGYSPAAVADTLTLNADGTYPAWLRNGLVEALQTAAAAPGLV